MPDNENTTLTSMEDLMEQTGAGSASDLDLSGTSNVPYDEDKDAPIIGQQYLATFQDLKDYEDLYEERTSSVCSGVHFYTQRQMEEWISRGYQKITVEEQNALVDGGVRRKSDGAIVPRPPVIVPLQSRIDSLLSQIDNYTAEQIVSGFDFNVTSFAPTGVAKFDSSKEDQMTFATMYAASKSPDFETTAPYYGHLPFRGRTKHEDGTYDEEKTLYYLDAANMQAFMDAMALSIGAKKSNGWSLQALAKSATEETIDEVEQQVWEAIGYDPNPEPETQE